MKKPAAIMVVVILFTLSSCGSSWSCKKSYCDTNQEQTKTTVVKTNIA
jgi:uncharacterized membrane protein YqjE